MNQPRIRPEWATALADAFAHPAMRDLSAFLRERKAAGAEIYPPSNQIFAALDAVPPGDVKCVILGQDPYPTRGNAHGFAFSVPMGVPVPQSLVNIHREIESDVGAAPPEHGNLEAWAAQGVLLLNTLLTVERGAPLAHKGKGWERFTDAVIAHVAASPLPTVFMLWGGTAQKKAHMIDDSRHLVIRTRHPLAAVGAHRMVRLAALQQGQRLPRAAWTRRHRLATRLAESGPRR